MKTKNIKTDNLVHVPEPELMALVITQLKGRVLFPEKIEAAKKYLKYINKKTTI